MKSIFSPSIPLVRFTTKREGLTEFEQPRRWQKLLRADWELAFAMLLMPTPPLYDGLLVVAERSTSVIDISICSPLGIDMLTFAVARICGISTTT
jgi:hypothetical protein